MGRTALPPPKANHLLLLNSSAFTVRPSSCEWRSIALTGSALPHMVRRSRLGGILGGAHSSAVEHLTFNQRADGSTPSGLTIPSSRLLSDDSIYVI
jgi:hypothetical protein